MRTPSEECLREFNAAWDEFANDMNGRPIPVSFLKLISAIERIRKETHEIVPEVGGWYPCESTTNPPYKGILQMLSDRRWCDHERRTYRPDCWTPVGERIKGLPKGWGKWPTTRPSRSYARRWRDMSRLIRRFGQSRLGHLAHANEHTMIGSYN